MLLTKETRDRIYRVAELATQAEYQAKSMGERSRICQRLHRGENRESGERAARWAILLRRAARLAELYAELSGTVREP